MPINVIGEGQSSSRVDTAINGIKSSTIDAVSLFEQILASYNVGNDDSISANQPSLQKEDGIGLASPIKHGTSITDDCLLFKPKGMVFAEKESLSAVALDQNNDSTLNSANFRISSEDFLQSFVQEVNFGYLNQRIAYSKNGEHTGINKPLDVSDNKWLLGSSPVIANIKLSSYSEIPFAQNIDFKVEDSQENTLQANGQLTESLNYFVAPGMAQAQFYDAQMQILKDNLCKIRSDNPSNAERIDISNKNREISNLHLLNENDNTYDHFAQTSEIGIGLQCKPYENGGGSYLLQDSFLKWSSSVSGDNVNFTSVNEVPDNSAAIAVSIVKQIQHSLHGKEIGKHTMHISLKPESLGALDITYEVGIDGQTQLFITMEKMSTFLLMEQNSHELRRLLHNETNTKSLENEGKLYLNWQAKNSLNDGGNQKNPSYSWREMHQENRSLNSESNLIKNMNITVAHSNYLFDIRV